MADRLLSGMEEKLRASDTGRFKVLGGFDGYVDTVVYPVDIRTGPDSYTRVKTLADFGRKFIDAAGLSLNMEMVPQNAKIGGIGAILANSLSLLGFDMTYIGAMGRHSLNPVYREFNERARLISISDPGLSDAVEFNDGKLISSKLEPLKDVNWDSLREVLTPQQLADMFDQADLVTCGGWTLTINVGTIYEGILREVFPLMKNEKRRWMFFDLSDPAKRTREDIMEVLDQVRRCGEKFNIGIGFNERESYEVAALYGRQKDSFSDIREVPEFLREKIGTSFVIVHPVKTACGCSASQSAAVEGPYCASPKLTTGAGDNFNAGFLTGLMLGLTLEESLKLGTANSGFYVRNARSAAYPELCDFVHDWAEGKV